MFTSSSTHVVLDHLLATLDIGVTHFRICDIRDGWELRLPANKLPSLHYCLEGSGTLIAHNAAPIPLESHTFVLLPPGVAYRVEGGPPQSSRCEHRVSLYDPSSQTPVPTLVIGDGQEGIVTACGELRAGLLGGSDLFASLNQPLVVRFGSADGLRYQFEMLLAESMRPEMGSRVLTEALLKQCLVLTLRRWIEIDSSSLPWLAGLADPRLSRVLHTIFEQPAVAYTVESLALMAGMSRSAFADAFRRAFGLSPMSLIKLVRLRRASELLITTTLPVCKVAMQAGFSSRSNFTVSFAELHGMDPSRFRRMFSPAEKGYGVCTDKSS